MNAITRPADRRLAATTVDPPHLHLAAAAMAFPVRFGALSYGQAASSLALAAIHDGALGRLTDQQFQALCGRLEHTMIQATIRIDHRAADAIRAAIRRPIADRRPRQTILLIAETQNMLHGQRFPSQTYEGAQLPRLPDVAVHEICRQEVRAAIAATRSAVKRAVR